MLLHLFEEPKAVSLRGASPENENGGYHESPAGLGKSLEKA
jgi:hypothetical protein